MRQVRQLMGMPITIDIPGAANDKVFDKVFKRLEQIDKRFSTYKPDSEVSKFARGELTEADLSDKLKEVIKACREAEAMTEGYFSAWAACLPDRQAGAFEPSGYVKGWAIAEAGKMIEKEGFKTYCISAGGDILARSDSDKIWNIGIQDPSDKSKMLNPSTGSGQANILKIKNGAVCTSGNYERGAHIINPKTQKPADELLSVTITGPDIIKADILATAVFASGTLNPNFLKEYPDYKALVIPRSRGSNR